MNALKFAVPFVLSALFLASLAWILVNSDPVEIPPAASNPILNQPTVLK